MTEGQIMDFEMVTQRAVPDHFDTNMVLYYVLEGEVQITVSGMARILRSRDFLLVNACQHHVYEEIFDALSVRFEISIPGLFRYYDMQGMEFCCDSTQGEKGYCRSFRRLLESCVEIYYEKTAGDGASLIRLNGIYYQILESLITYFARHIMDRQTREQSLGEVRMNEVVSYIHANYKRRITLLDLSRKMQLSTAYVSRYIKKQLGKTFRDYTVEVRLNYALAELKNTQKTMGRIALENGFPNQSSFQRAFQRYYHKTPNRYREEYLSRAMPIGEEEARLVELEYRLLHYLEERREQFQEEEENLENLDIDTLYGRDLPKDWCKMINIGTAETLLSEEVQKHVLLLQERLHIQYIRLLGLMEEGMCPYKEGALEFEKADQALDFLLKCGLRPYVVVRKKNAYLERILAHFVKRYGQEEVSQWYFEQWCDPSMFRQGAPEGYFRAFETVAWTIKKMAPKVKVGGAYDGRAADIDYCRMISEWSVRECQPDFISLYCCSIQTQGKDNAGEAGFLTSFLVECRQFTQEWGMNVPMHIGEWSLTGSSLSILNDSSFQGAYMVKNMMDLCFETEMAGYWLGTDLASDRKGKREMLSGSSGLISDHGICKPSFYGMEFMGCMKGQLLGRSEHVMVAMENYDEYTIVCHNYKHPGFHWDVLEGEGLNIKRLPLFFSNEDGVRGNITIHHVRNGRYKVRTKSISRSNGSVQDEWMKMGLSDELDEQDIRYLHQICTPKVSIREHRVEHQTLELTLSLKAHEIQCIQISRRDEREGQQFERR